MNLFALPIIYGTELWYKRGSAIDLVVGKMVIPVSSEYKYLGVVLDQFMTYKSALADRTKKAFRAFWGICSTEYSGNQLPISVYKKLFESVVAPVVNYGALFWSHRFSDQEVEKVQFKAYRYFLGGWKKTSTSGIICRYVLDAIQMSSQITSSTFLG